MEGDHYALEYIDYSLENKREFSHSTQLAFPIRLNQISSVDVILLSLC